MTRRWGKIETGFWLNPKVHELSNEDKLLMLYLIACPHGTQTGIFVLPKQYVAIDLNWNGFETVSKPFRNLSERKLIEAETKNHVLRICGWWGHNTIPNVNVAKSYAKQIALIPECSVKANYLQEVAECSDFSPQIRAALLSGCDETVSKRFRKGMAIEREKEIGEREGDEQYNPQPAAAENRKEPPAYTKTFADWWVLYPRKLDKKKAFDQYVKARKKVSAAVLKTALQAYVAELEKNKTEKCFVIYPERWLKNERWNDTVDDGDADTRALENLTRDLDEMGV